MPSFFRTALLAESALNIASVIPQLISPASALYYLVDSPAQITPTAEGLMQLLGGAVILATAPLLLSVPEDGPKSDILARRRLTYQTMGIAEFTLGAITLSQYIGGNSGLNSNALLVASGTMGLLTSLRAFFVYVRPDLMEPDGGKGKTL